MKGQFNILHCRVDGMNSPQNIPVPFCLLSLPRQRLRPRLRLPLRPYPTLPVRLPCPLLTLDWTICHSYPCYLHRRIQIQGTLTYFLLGLHIPT
jgi:hypothetical protein